MYQPTAARSESQYRSPPSPAVSLAFAALTVGFVMFVSIVMMAPAVVAAFGAGALTAAVVTLVHRAHVESRGSRVLADGRATHR
jgi:hypothetical protein